MKVEHRLYNDSREEVTDDCPHHLPELTRVFSSESWADFELVIGRGRGRPRSEWDGPAVGATSSSAGTGAGWTGLGVYVKERSLLAANATSSFSSNPFVGPRLHRSGVCLANASLNFLIWNRTKTKTNIIETINEIDKVRVINWMINAKC